MMSASTMFAQGTILAVLRHGDQLSTFYGVDALKSAMNAADHGDVITLSSGTFEGADITKAVTIRGAGFETDTIAKTNPTILVNSFNINVPDTISQRLMVEGIYSNYTISVYNTLNNASFQKCRFYSFGTRTSNSSSTNGKMKNVTFMHCKFVDVFYEENSLNSVLFVNCFVTSPYTNSDSSNTFEFNNCIVRWITNIYGSDYGTYTPNYTNRSVFKNCILIYRNSTALLLTNYVYNCLAIIGSNDFLSRHVGRAGESFTTATDYAGVFKSYKGTYNDAMSFELTDEAKTKYVGVDGTELGIYGGSLPFSSKVLSPQITKCDVAQKTTADGKLSVDIEVKGVE